MEGAQWRRIYVQGTVGKTCQQVVALEVEEGLSEVVKEQEVD